MKKWVLLLCSALSLTVAYGQSREVRLNLNAGLFSFSGESAERTSSINYDLRNEDGYTNNPYGAKGGLSYGLSIGVTRIFKRSWLIGMEAGYERLRSKITIDRISASDEFTSETIAADGRTYLNQNVINVYPKVGYRLATSRLNIDLVGGFDLAYCLSVYESGRAQSSTREFSTRRDRKTIRTDIRPRVQANVSRGNYGVYVGYSRGLRNYRSGYVGGANGAWGNVLRFGVSRLLL